MEHVKTECEKLLCARALERCIPYKETWNIPENAEKPERSNKKKVQPVTLLEILQEEKVSRWEWESGEIDHVQRVFEI